jgi:hypothetical protein
LREGDQVEFVVEDRRTIVRFAKAKENASKKYEGILGLFPGGEKAIVAYWRDLRW